MAGGSSEYDEFVARVRVKKGLVLDRSTATPGALRATARDSNGELASQAELFPVAQLPDDREPADEDTGPGLLPLALGVIGGAALVFAAGRASKISERRRADRAGDPVIRDVRPAGWYEVEVGSSKLRYWNGDAWTDQFAHRETPAGIPAGWYPDPVNPNRLRFWAGTAWTHHVHVQAGIASPAPNWYRDPVHAAQWRYWDGTSWTHHVAPVRGLPAAPEGPTIRTAPQHADVAQREPAIEMSADEWKAHFRAWVAAGAVEQELWRRLSHAIIRDGDPATLEARRMLNLVTPAEAGRRARHLLDGNPALRDEVLLAVLGEALGTARLPREPDTTKAPGPWTGGLRDGGQGGT